MVGTEQTSLTGFWNHFIRLTTEFTAEEEEEEEEED